MTNHTIHSILGIEAKDRTFEFEGRTFEYYAEVKESQRAETLFTRWADGSRSASPLHLGRDVELLQQVAVLLSHKFRKGVSAAEREDIIARAKATLG